MDTQETGPAAVIREAREATAHNHHHATIHTTTVKSPPTSDLPAVVAAHQNDDDKATPIVRRRSYTSQVQVDSDTEDAADAAVDSASPKPKPTPKQTPSPPSKSKSNAKSKSPYSSLPPVNAKSTKPKLSPERSMDFQHKVAKHQFRDFDDTKHTKLQTDRHPTELGGAGAGAGAGAPAAGGAALTRERSLAMQKKVAKHQFRDFDAEKKNGGGFRIDKRARPLEEKHDDDADASGAKNNKDRRRSVAVQKKVAAHQFRDFDADKKKEGGFRIDKRARPLEEKRDDDDAADAAAKNNKDRRRSVAVQKKVAAHQFRDFDSDKKKPKDAESSGSASGKKPAFHISKQDHPLDHSEYDTPEARQRRREAESSVQAKVRQHEFRAFDSVEQPSTSVNTHNATASATARTPSKTPSKPTITITTTTTTTTTTPAKVQTARGSGSGSGSSPPQRVASKARIDDDHAATPVRQTKATSLARKQSHHVSAPSAHDAPDASFPRQPRANPESLDVPVGRISDLLFDKYSTGGKDRDSSVFPTARLSIALEKLWPGNKLEDNDTIDLAVQTIVGDRGASAASSTGVAKEDSDPAKRNDDADAAAAAAAAPPLPDDMLSHREYQFAIRLISTINNWWPVLGADTPKVMSVEEFAIVADKLKIEKPGKLFMELTDNGAAGDTLALGKLAKHFASQRRRSITLGVLQHSLSHFASAREQARERIERERAREEEEAAAAARPKVFPRQPKCSPEDLTLPTARILSMIFDKYAVAEEEVNGSDDKPAEEKEKKDGEGGDGDDHPEKKPAKLFPLAKMHTAMAKIWPGMLTPYETVDAAVDAVLDERDSGDAASRSKDYVTMAEFTHVFRSVANLNNWRIVVPHDTPQLLTLEPFAVVADRLKIDKPGKLFMELTNNGARDGVSQAQLALYYSHKRKTLRFDKDKLDKEESDADDEDHGNSDDDENDANKNNSSGFHLGMEMSSNEAALFGARGKPPSYKSRDPHQRVVKSASASAGELLELPGVANTTSSVADDVAALAAEADAPVVGADKTESGSGKAELFQEDVVAAPSASDVEKKDDGAAAAAPAAAAPAAAAPAAAAPAAAAPAAAAAPEPEPEPTAPTDGAAALVGKLHQILSADELAALRRHLIGVGGASIGDAVFDDLVASGAAREDEMDTARAEISFARVTPRDLAMAIDAAAAAAAAGGGGAGDSSS